MKKATNTMLLDIENTIKAVNDTLNISISYDFNTMGHHLTNHFYSLC